MSLCVCVWVGGVSNQPNNFVEVVLRCVVVWVVTVSAMEKVASMQALLADIFEKIVDIFDKQQIFGSFYTSMPTILHDYPQLIQVIRKYPMYWKKLQSKAFYMLMK